MTWRTVSPVANLPTPGHINERDRLLSDAELARIYNAAADLAYALSPIDLIPDFIPVMGYLDELILLPLSIAGVVRLIDPAVMVEHRATAAEMAEQPTSRLGAALIAAIWLFAITLIASWFFLARVG